MTEAVAVCVLKTGGDFDAFDVYSLKSQVMRHTGLHLHCLTDDTKLLSQAYAMPLLHGWRGWWSKMELFRPDFHNYDFFYLDLDTVLVRNCKHLATTGKSTMLSDFYYPEKPASGLMYIRAEDRAEVWSRWMTNPDWHMGHLRGDQDFLAHCAFGENAQRWQKSYPYEVISFKANMRPTAPRMGPQLKEPPTAAKIVCFHGKPRPKTLREDWVLEARAVA